MKKKLAFTGLCFVLLIPGMGVHAQTAATAAGGEASGSGGSASYSVGQVACLSDTGEGGTVLKGVQQPYEISVITSVKEATGIHLSVMVYPNPTPDYLMLEVKEFDYSTLTYRLYDMNGKLLQAEKITANQTRIDMGNLPPATYLVKVIQGNSEVKTFKVMKNK